MLLENEGILPLAAGTKLNVFGWASTNPMLGGGGSGALNTAYESVSLLQSRRNNDPHRRREYGEPVMNSLIAPGGKGRGTS